MIRLIMWAGNVYQGDLGYILGDLTDFEALDSECSNKELVLLSSILYTIQERPENSGLSELEESISGLFPSDKSERKRVLEILGFCGVLEPKDFPSMHHQWTPICELPKSVHSHRKECRSPVNCWTGADELNHEAIGFWFGDL